jgi:hypothetical protein
VNVRTASASLLVVAALSVAPVTAAFASGSGDSHPGAVKSATARAHAKAKAHKIEHAANARRSFVLGGKVTAVDATAGTVTFTLHGTRFRALRGSDVTVTVNAATKVRREGAATLADVLVGDHVVARCVQLDVTISKDASGAWRFDGSAVAVRLVANATAASVVPVAPVVPVDPTVPTDPTDSTVPVAPTA